ncbi:MAG: GntR family transcriptional regulator [Candidatus Pacebacteria bacterium]|nr:GntR family transcriptional regulator [Candidatus Paceibacterota bacterium]
MKRQSPSWEGAVTREKAAYKRLIQEIHRCGLRSGDKLPPQQELRSQLGFSNSSLSRAMSRLVADGIVARKSRVGTIVVDPAAGDLSAWTVGLLLNWELTFLPSPFHTQLTFLLQQRLAVAGCHCRAYVRVHNELHKPNRLHDYLNLAEDIEGGLVDGLIMLGPLNGADERALLERTIPVCYSTSWQTAPRGSVIDEGGFGREAVQELHRRGGKRLAIVTADYRQGRTQFQDSAQAVASTIPGTRFEQIDAGVCGLEGGRNAAGILLGCPPHERPDSLIISDDHIALGLAQVLRLESDYAPTMAVVTHSSAPLAFALPILHYELDDAKLADSAVRIFIDRLRYPELPDHVERIVPRLSEQDAAHMVPAVDEELSVALV